MQRLSDDRGAIGVIVVMLILPLLAFTALSVDVGAGYLKKRQLQNGSDAAALAIAADCGRGACGNISSTATTFAAANVRTGGATATATVTGNQVTAIATGTVTYSFAPIIGMNSKSITTRSKAAWGTPSGGKAQLPIAFSWCSFQAQTGGGLPTGSTPVTILLPKTDGTVCTGQSGNPVPGGFAWLKADSTGCTATTSIATLMVYSDPGRSLPSVCSTSDISALLNKTILVPIFDKFGGTGSGAWYHIFAYAAFRITGYFFGGQYKSSPAPCNGSSSCIAGYFTKYVEPTQAFTYSSTAPDLGARITALIA